MFLCQISSGETKCLESMVVLWMILHFLVANVPNNVPASRLVFFNCIFFRAPFHLPIKIDTALGDFKARSNDRLS